MNDNEENKKRHTVGNTPEATQIANTPEVVQLWVTIMALITSLGGDSIESLIAWSPAEGVPQSPYLIQIHVQPIADEDLPLLQERLGIVKPPEEPKK